MRHPFENLAPRRQRRLYWFFLVATLVVAAGMQGLSQGFANKPNENGETFDIVAFEFARTPERAQEMVDTWGTDGVRAATLNSVLDYVFMVCYSSLIALGVLSVASGVGAAVRLARVLAWAQWGAALLDAVENAALLRILSGAVASPWPETAFYCASLKFVLIVAGLLFILLALPLNFREVPQKAA